MNADGSGLRAITSGPFDDREPSWSRDGNRIAFSSDRSGNYDVWDLDVAGRRGAPTDEQSPRTITRRRIRRSTRRSRLCRSARIAAACGRRRRHRRRASWRRRQAPSVRRRGAPDGSKVIYNVIAANHSHLMLDGRAITRDEDVFPFRAQWVSPTEVIYTADGKIKKRSRCRAATPCRSNSRRPCRSRARRTSTRFAISIRAAPRPVRGIMAPVISPDGTQVAFAALGDLWLMPIRLGSGTARR